MGNWSDVKLPMLAMQSYTSMVIANTTGNRRRNSWRGRETREKMREKHPDFTPTACTVAEKPRGKRSFCTDKQVLFKRFFTSVARLHLLEFPRLGEILNYWLSFQMLRSDLSALEEGHLVCQGTAGSL